MFRIIVLLKPPLSPQHFVYLWEMSFYYFNVKFTIHDASKTEKTSLSFDTKSSPSKNLMPVFWHQADRPCIFIPTFNCVAKELEGSFISKDRLFPIVIKGTTCPCNTIFIMS